MPRTAFVIMPIRDSQKQREEHEHFRDIYIGFIKPPLEAL